MISAASRARPWTAAAALVVAVLAACSSSPSPPTTVGLARLRREVGSAIERVQSVSVVERTRLFGSVEAAAADEQLSGGHSTAMRADLSGSGGRPGYRLLLVGDRLWAQLPTSLGGTPGAFFPVTADSRNAFVRTLSRTARLQLRTISLTAVADDLAAATSAQRVGPASLDGVDVTEYRLSVDPRRLVRVVGSGTPADVPSLPVHLYVDAMFRPVFVVSRVRVRGQTNTSALRFGNYGEHLAITAPTP